MKKQLEKQVIARIKAYHEKGYAIGQIRQALREKKYPTSVIRKLLREAGVTYAITKEKIIGGVVILGVIVLIIGGVQLLNGKGMNENSNQCMTKDCFVEAANNCGKSVMVQDEQGLRIMYEVENCKFIKTVIEVPAEEPEELRRMVEGKSLECVFDEGLFNEAWVDTLSIGIEECEGDLKESLEEITIIVNA